jgi:outer membrane protein assembly factor BamB
MLFYPRRPRSGRLLDVVVPALLLLIFAGLAANHFIYLWLSEREGGPVREQLADRTFAGHDWPQWRGPNRDGVAIEPGLITTWPSGGPKALWEAKVGDGFASVIVVKGRVFTIFQDGGNEAIVSWDAETGNEIWRFSYSCDYKNPFGNGPRSTPCIDGELLYAVGATGIMHCLKAFGDDPKGERVWKKNLLEEFAAAPSQWGVAFSPLVDGDRVFIMPGGPNGNSLAALDKRTGAVLWKRHDDLASYSSPLAATIHDVRQILFLTGSRLVSVKPDTGEQLWDYPWPIENQCNIATPIVEKDLVFIASSYGRGYVLLRIEKDEGAWKPRFEHKNKKAMRNHMSTCVRHKDYLYGFDDTNLTCMNFLTGDIEWQKRGFDKGSILAVNDQLIVYGANGILALVDANPKKYVERGSFQFSNAVKSCWSVPVVSNGRLYMRDQEKLVCYDVRAGK